jgi:hypothetical protein
MSHAAYVDHAEDEARAAALKQWRVKATPKPPEEPEEFLKLYQHVSDEQAAAPTPRAELIYATNRIIEFVLEVLGEAIGGEAKRVDKQTAKADAKIVALEATVDELTGQVADLTHRLERDLASRGVKDGASLPEALVRPKPRAARAAPKRNPNGAASEARP